MFDILKQSSTRIKTGIALVVVLLIIGFVDSFFLTWVLFGGLMMVALNEAMKLFQIDEDKIYVYALVMWIGAYFYPKPEDLIFIVGLIFASILAYTKELNKQLFLPLMYPMASYLFLFSLYISFGMESLLWLLVVVAGTDVGAYFVGKSIGATSFCQTSPNKTLEGVAGGVITAAILGVTFTPDTVSFAVGLFVSLVVAVASVFGDLFESYLKREADVKDSGDILPGHGGILDRTDGYLFGGIVMLIMLRMFI
ncbi:MAG: phosphatidate cytidylyltransferase [Campylobacterota bacterium]|nr:phosphatidate cytidylyltransferase [Campylobacterota bacterium]